MVHSCDSVVCLVAAVVRRKTLLHADLHRSGRRGSGQSRASGADEGRTPAQAGHLHRASRPWERRPHRTRGSSDRGQSASASLCLCCNPGALWPCSRVCLQHKWKYFNSVSDEAVSHADFMSVLSNVEYIIIKASYGSGLQQSRSFLHHSHALNICNGTLEHNKLRCMHHQEKISQRDMI